MMTPCAGGQGWDRREGIDWKQLLISNTGSFLHHTIYWNFKCICSSVALNFFILQSNLQVLIICSLFSLSSDLKDIMMIRFCNRGKNSFFHVGHGSCFLYLFSVPQIFPLLQWCQTVISNKKYMNLRFSILKYRCLISFQFQIEFI